MATIMERAGKHGVKYLVRIRLRSSGIPKNINKTFNSRREAQKWAKEQEHQIKTGVSVDYQYSIAWLITKVEGELPSVKSRTVILARLLKTKFIQEKLHGFVTAEEFINFALQLGETRSAGTINNDMNALKVIFEYAHYKNYSDVYNEFLKAKYTLKKNRIISAGGARERRPSREEMQSIFNYIRHHTYYRLHATNLINIIKFAIFSARRKKEIFSLEWSDLNIQQKTILVKKAKHPTNKNFNILAHLPHRALNIILKQKKESRFIFKPQYKSSLKYLWTRFKPDLAIHDLKFHDLRHEAISHLAEQHLTIAQISLISGHQEWNTLKKYVNLTQLVKFDKWEKLDA